MKQSRAMSLVESITNVTVGYGLAIATQMLVFPLFGLPARLGDAFAIGAIFTAVSIARSFALRRLFEHMRAIHDTGSRTRNAETDDNRGAGYRASG